MKLLAMLILISCSSNVMIQDKEPPQDQVDFHLKIINLESFSTNEKEIFNTVVLKTEKIIKSNEFKNKVLGFSFNGENKFHYTNDSPSKVYENILSSSWILDYRKKWLWNKSTIAYTTPQISHVVINSRQFNNLLESDLSKNICHEIGGHKIGGYDHETKWNKNRDYSVPYAIGKMCKELYEEGEK